MLKTRRDEQTWLVSQPDHGAVAGYLAAHWGNDHFAAPGHFADAHDPDQLCAETVLAIAEHDNGWWEWEAIPELGDLDNLPLDLAEVLKNQQEGMDRWRRGIPRFSEEHPYVSLLISFHAYWLYAARSKPDPDPAFLHHPVLEGMRPKSSSWDLSTKPASLLLTSKRSRPISRPGFGGTRSPHRGSTRKT